MAGVAQSLAFAKALGVEPQLFLEAISGGPLDTPYAQLKGKAILGGNYDPSFALDGVLKDLGLMVDAANAVDFPADLLDAVRGVYPAGVGRGARQRGHGRGAVRVRRVAGTDGPKPAATEGLVGRLGSAAASPDRSNRSVYVRILVSDR